MNPLDDLNKAFSSKYSQDQNLEFKVLMRRDKLFGLWAAELLGLGDDAAKDFARTVIEAEVDGHSVVHKVWQDLTGRECAVTEDELQLKLMELQEVARQQVEVEGVDPTVFINS